MAANLPQMEPLRAAASALNQRHQISGLRPAAIPLMRSLRLLPKWFADLQNHCICAKPEASKAAEWLLDNHFQVNRAIRQIKNDLPKEFYARLPKLNDPNLQGAPRIYSVADGLLNATHLQLSMGTAIEYVKAYQESARLTIAELWAFPTMLRTVCLETLVAGSQEIFPLLEPPYKPNASPPFLQTIEPTERIARALSILQVIAGISWNDFFDKTSVVEEILGRDPAGVYSLMDFETRDRYRKAVEEIAARTVFFEHDVATRIIAEAKSHPRDIRLGHVGYWLTGQGERIVRAKLGYQPPIKGAIRAFALRHASTVYWGTLIFFWILALIAPILYLHHNSASAATLSVGVFLTAIPASILSLTLMTWIFPLFFLPRILPKLNFKKKIHADCPTAVVMPVIIGSAKEAEKLIQRLEQHRLANSDPALQFVLLSDLTDAAAEMSPRDRSTEDALVSGVRKLNDTYGHGEKAPFHLLHRRRRYNPSEECWMAWERKRGKLEQFNQFILSGAKGDFALIVGRSEALRKTRYVVTVDADTVLPLGAVNRLIGACAHPLNQAIIDPDTGQLIDGYTIIQPRIEIAPRRDNHSNFSRYFSGDSTIDIYSRAVSDIFQDIFGEAVYVGKGVYDVRAFEQSTKSRIPENTLLSHDLFEGSHGRVALASDIVFYDGFPANYLDFARRWRRWVRGDWQLLPWLAPRVPGAGGKRFDNVFSALDHWKVIDNLRRSLVPPSLVLLAISGWLVMPGDPWVWSAFTLLAPGAYIFTDLARGLTRGRRRESIHSALRQFANHSGRWSLAITFLLYESFVSLSAITITLWRVLVSRRKLLQWTSAAHSAVRFEDGESRRFFWFSMWPAPLLSSLIAGALFQYAPHAVLSASPLLLAWFFSPEIAFRSSRPIIQPADTLSESQKGYLRGVARRTWLFFESFVGPEDNWLPPDNFQDDPEAKIAHRTSPTNIGMLLVSSLSAWDFGYVSSTDLTVRANNLFDTLDKMNRHRGHFYNWYDTRTLAPLDPRYVSTVDSGNLAVCLITLKEGFLEAARSPFLRNVEWSGLQDCFSNLENALERALNDSGNTALAGALNDMKAVIAKGEWRDGLNTLLTKSWPSLESLIAESIAGKKNLAVENLHEVNIWIERVSHDLQKLKWGIDNYLPWLQLLATPPAQCAELAGRISVLLSPSLDFSQLATNTAETESLIDQYAGQNSGDQTSEEWINNMRTALKNGRARHRDLYDRLFQLSDRAEQIAYEMDFSFLYDREFRLFSIGYNVSVDRIDPHHYDLLATEARLASYFAIAKGDVPPEHWQTLGRPISRVDSDLSLLSWNGSMFEYLMPTIWMRGGFDSLLEQAERTAVSVQRQYADDRALPWGISESGFAARNAANHYQYQAFGVPGLGLKRGLANDLVIAPYASALALAISPAAAVDNLQNLASLGALRTYGFIEAVDYTPERAVGKRPQLVYAYMAHHQGMVLAAIGNALNNDNLVSRFLSSARMQSAELLLEERAPWELPPEFVRDEELATQPLEREQAPSLSPWPPAANSAVTQMNFLGNGRLASWISQDGAGALNWHQHALTRWRQDMTCENDGFWIYVRDLQSHELWSAGNQPTGVISPDAHVQFYAHKAEFHRRDHGIAIAMDIGVAAGDDLEIRLLTIANETDQPRSLEITSCGEVVLAPPLDDARHPAFSKLFVQSEHISDADGLMFTRRPHHPTEQPPAVLHRLILDDLGASKTSFETDRRAFFGRNGDAHRPLGVTSGLSRTVGWTLDPLASLQAQIDLAPRQRRQVAFVTIVAGSRQSVLDTADRYSTLASLEWALHDAGREAGQIARRMEIRPEWLSQFQRLASLAIDPQASSRASSVDRKANNLGQPRLWSLGISGDNPIILLKTSDADAPELLQFLVHAHEYWRRCLFRVDLVISRVGLSGYVETARERLLSILRDIGAHDALGHNGGIHLVFADQISIDDKRLLESASSIILDDVNDSVDTVLATAMKQVMQSPPFERSVGHAYAPEPDQISLPSLEFSNGLGGFTTEGEEYIIHVDAGENTPAPWSNIIANDQFGFLTTESGLGCTWSVNSGENRLTPWRNDPVCNPLSEALYLRDEESSEVWTVTPSPAGEGGACEIRHGAGYTIWQKASHGLFQEMKAYAATDDPVKFVKLSLRNPHNKTRRITATYYAEWQLGSIRSTHAKHILCEYDPASEALLARNPWNPEFGERVAFLSSNRPPHSLTTNRRDFLGQCGGMTAPAGLRRWDLGGRLDATVDPCAAYQIHIDIGPNETADVVFILGQGENRRQAGDLIGRWRSLESAEKALSQLYAHWDKKLSIVTVETPDPAFDIIVNRWLLYQTLSSRIMARAGFYQAGGAIGFRDQLQDVLALLHIEPERARAHILDCARRQFEEGDVLHWWHPPLGRGVRTRCSDDLLWLPFVTSEYVEATGDLSVLDEEIPYLKAPPLSPEENDRYALYEITAQKQSLFDHCARALERGITTGAHGLPLIGAGDWNDGMNRIGAAGRGESVWLAWFAIATMNGFSALARQRDRNDLAERWEARIRELRDAVEEVAWDGEWYMRAFDDDGLPWGSKDCDECRIDSISQSWAVLSGGKSERAQVAMRSAQRELLNDKENIARLLWPPVHDTPRDPGYLKAYPPGIRENGGQYSHAAAWLGIAFAELGDGDTAARIFDMINPIRRTATKAGAGHYRNEPYAVSADIAGVEPHAGRGGWSWYTGAAAWTWRLGVEAILGVKLKDGKVELKPCLPKSWGAAKVWLKRPEGKLLIEIKDPDHLGTGEIELTIDGVIVEDSAIEFPTDGGIRTVHAQILKTARADQDKPAMEARLQ